MKPADTRSPPVDTATDPDPIDSSPSDRLADESTRLPVQFQRIAQLIGHENALKLVDDYGGCRLSVPVHIEAEHPIAGLIGIAAAEVLVREFGGDRIGIPRCRALRAEQRNRRIREDHASGLSYPALARKYRLTERHISTILQGTTEPG